MAEQLNATRSRKRAEVYQFPLTGKSYGQMLTLGPKPQRKTDNEAASEKRIYFRMVVFHLAHPPDIVKSGLHKSK